MEGKKLLEIEIKAYCKSYEQIVSEIRSAGAQYKETTKQHDIYFNHPERDFIITDEALRIRQSSSGVVLTYKGPKLPGITKSRTEEEVNVGKAGSMERILINLGFRKSGEVKKTRDIYILDDITICIDRVEGLGTFIELEKISTEKKEAEDELLALAEKLSLGSFVKKSYLEMILEGQS